MPGNAYVFGCIWNNGCTVLQLAACGQTAAARYRTHKRGGNILKLVHELRQDLLVDSEEKLEHHNQRQATDGGRTDERTAGDGPDARAITPSDSGDGRRRQGLPAGGRVALRKCCVIAGSGQLQRE